MSKTTFKPLTITIEASRGGARSAQGRERFEDQLSVDISERANMPFANGASRLITPSYTDGGQFVKVNLDREVDNPWYKMRAANKAELNRQIPQKSFKIQKRITPKELEKLLETPSITREEVLALRFNLTEAQLSTSRGKVTPILTRKEAEGETSLWADFSIDISTRTHTFDDTTLQGALACEVILGSDQVAESKRAFSSMTHLFYIVDHEESQRVREAKASSWMEAQGELAKFLKEATEFDLHALAILLGVIRVQTTPASTRAALTGFLDKSGKERAEAVALFEKTMLMFRAAPGARNSMLTRYIFESAKAARMFVTRNGEIVWTGQESEPSRYSLGSTKQSAMNTIRNWIDEKTDDTEVLTVLGESLHEVGVKVPDELR